MSSPDSTTSITPDSTTKSTEEADYLERSIKKIKSDHLDTQSPVESSPVESKNKGPLSASVEIPSQEDTHMEHQGEISAAIKEIPKPIEKARSFKATLLNEFKSTKNLEQNRSEFDEISDDEDMDPQDPPKTKSRIEVNF